MSSLFKVFSSPRELFEKLDQKPVWVLPMVTVVAVGVVMTLVLLPTVIRPNAVDKLDDTMQGSEEDLERVKGILAGPVLYISSLAAVLLGVPAKMLVISGIYTLILLPLTGEQKFRRLLSVTSHSAVIGAFGGIVGGALMVARRSMEVSMGLNLFLPFVEKGTFLHRLLMQTNFFTIWSLFVFSIGLGIVGRMSTKKSCAMVFGLWVVAILLGAGMTGLRPHFSGLS